MRFLIQCKLGILSLGVNRACAKLTTHPMQNRLRISGSVPQWPKCFYGIGWDQFYSFITWKLLYQGVFVILSLPIGPIRKIFYASSNKKNYSHLQIQLVIIYIKNFQIRYCGSQCERHTLCCQSIARSKRLTINYLAFHLI